MWVPRITIVSPAATTADFGYLAGAGAVNDVDVKAGTNVFRLAAHPGDSGYISINISDGAPIFPMTYVAPEGCKHSRLSFEFVHACGAQTLIKVINSGEAAAEGMFVYRRDNSSPPLRPKRQLVAGDLTFPVGASYVLVDKLVGEFQSFMIDQGVDTGNLWPYGPVQRSYREPAGCAAAPEVSAAAPCTGGLDITSTPADAVLTTLVLGQPNDPERTGTARHVDLAKDEALLVKSGDMIVAAFVYQGPASCAPPAPLPSPEPILAVTGDRTSVPLFVGSGLLLVGTVTLAFARRRRGRGVR
ncbi:MAG TPA: hypothetical protein VFC19_50510 [Candidatus Limnocylindrales bacterium]|nr:hypothetical protein [Candidatus Limnocylindrales bacterium]